jgi:hypothetical protein
MAGNKQIVRTLQSNIKEYDSSFITNYSLFLGGLNATQASLEQYDPLKTGYNRIFLLRMPVFMQKILPDQTKRFRHLVEYGFTKIDGIGNTSLETEQLTGGYAGRSFDVGTVAKDETQAVTISLYEFAGSPVREYLDMWISGISDPYTGLGHYHGAMDIDPSIKYSQHNHVMEAIYVATDPTGRSDGVEYACLLTNMIPKQVKKDHFNYESGTHGLVTVDCEFSAVKYESPQINQVAKSLMARFQTMKDYLDFNSEYTQQDVNDHYKPKIINWNDAANEGANE